MAAPNPPLILPPFNEATARLKVQLAEEFFHGRAAIRAFSRASGSTNSAYEPRDTDGKWWRSHGNEHWEFDQARGLTRRRDASINDYPIAASERQIALP